MVLASKTELRLGLRDRAQVLAPYLCSSTAGGPHEAQGWALSPPETHPAPQTRPACVRSLEEALQPSSRLGWAHWVPPAAGLPLGGRDKLRTCTPLLLLSQNLGVSPASHPSHSSRLQISQGACTQFTITTPPPPAPKFKFNSKGGRGGWLGKRHTRSHSSHLDLARPPPPETLSGSPREGSAWVMVGRMGATLAERHPPHPGREQGPGRPPLAP